MGSPFDSTVTCQLDRALLKYRRVNAEVIGETLSPIQIAESIRLSRKWLTERGYIYIDGGSSRDVFIMPGKEHVVKIQPCGSSNNREIEMSSRDIPCLVPVLEHSICGGWLVMPYAEEHPSGAVPNSEKGFVEHQIHLSGWTVQDFGDIRYINGEPHLCDYGAPWRKLH
jgi:hypothetical protein